MKKITYRKYIQGLRAVEVLLVVFFHLNIFHIQSGLLGVDIFFVISGFLITSIIDRDIKKNVFSIRHFYLKRMRRILPALLFVLFFTTIMALIILFPPSLIRYSSSVLASVTSIANIYFWKIVPTGYFRVDTHTIPLIHIWSLGVEEQFYLFWPLFIVLGRHFFSKRIFFITCIFITILSCLSAFFFWFYGRTGIAFYSPTSRAFELLFGCLLAFYDFSIPGLSKKQNVVLAFFGLLLIIFPVFFTTPDSSLSGLWELMVCSGTVLLIYTGKKETVVSNFLSSRPLIFFGLISYSLYLWHWPIFAYARYLNIPMTIPVKFFIFLISVCFAFFTYIFVENFFREKLKLSFIKTCFYFLILPIFISVFFVVITKISFGFENRFSKTIITMANMSNSPGYAVLGNCFDGNPSKPESEEKCLIGDKSRKKTTVLIIGDSHAASDINMLDVILKNKKLKGYVVSLSSTLYLPKTSAVFSTEKQVENNAAITDIIMHNHFKYIIMAGLWSSYNDEAKDLSINLNAHYTMLRKGLISALNVITSQSAIPVIVLDTPPPLTVLPNCSVISKAFKFNFLNCKTDEKSVQTIQYNSRKMIIGLKKIFPTVIFIDPSEVLCNKKSCQTQINNIPVYYDSMFDPGIHNNGHLTALASTEIGLLYIKKHPNLK